MKFTKMSLVAALLIGSSAFAIENTKVSGDAKLYYNTNDMGTSTSVFSAGTSAAQAAFGLGITTDLVTGVSAGMHVTALTTLGLQGALVGNVWEGTNGVTDSWIMDEAWLATTVGKTTVKLGRMELDTPLVFSEKWSIVANTFEAAVIINQDIPDTTLVGAYVGGSNGGNNVNATFGNGNPVPGIGIANRIQTSNNETTFSQFYHGAYAAAVINNSFKPLTLQAWYYQAPQFLDSYWLQADLSMEGITAGLQYNAINYSKTATLPIAKDATASVFAGKLGYTMKDVVTVSAAYSQTDKETDSSLGLQAGQNLATFHNGAQSKLYTEAWWNYGYVTRADTSAINVQATGSVASIDLGAYYTTTTTGNNDVAGVADITMSELTITASKSVGPLDATLAYINTSADDQNSGDAYNTIQAYLTLNF